MTNRDTSNTKKNVFILRIRRFHHTFPTVIHIYFVPGCVIALCLFVLSTKHLIIVYMYLMSVGVVFVSYWTNVSMIRQVYQSHSSSSILDDLLSLNIPQLLQPSGPASIVLQSYLIQTVLSFVFVHVHLGPRHSILQKLLPVSFLAPSVLATLPLPSSFVGRSPVFAALLPLALLKYVLWSSVMAVVRTLCDGYVYARNFVSNFGMAALVEAEWMRLGVPEVLRTFWVLRALEHAGAFLVSGLWTGAGTEPLFQLIKSLMVSGCETLTAVLGITSIVSFMCNNIGRFFQWVLLTEENDKNIGTVSAILFYILALQTGLTGLEPEKR